MRRIASIVSAAAAALLLCPGLALACPVCFGASDAPAAQGMNMAIYVMLGFTGVVLGCFMAAIVVLARRARMFREAEHEWRGDMAESRV